MTDLSSEQIDTDSIFWESVKSDKSNNLISCICGSTDIEMLDTTVYFGRTAIKFYCTSGHFFAIILANTGCGATIHTSYISSDPLILYFNHDMPISRIPIQYLIDNKSSLCLDAYQQKCIELLLIKNKSQQNITNDVLDWKNCNNEQEKYNLYLNSREWSIKKEAVRTRCNMICERCKKNTINSIHHLTYIRKYDELLEDLIGLCRGCHLFIHAKSDIDPCI